MYIIDESYFIKELKIPNTTEVDVIGSSVPFEMWIDEKARLCLQDALGWINFSSLDSNVTNGVYAPGVTKWDRLVNGISYTYQSETYIWKGLKFSEGTFKGSILAYFVYCKWLEFQLSQMTGMGEARGEAVNSMSVNSTYRYVTLWNTFVEMYQGRSDYGYHFSYIHGVPFHDYYGNDNEDGYVSLIEFIEHNKLDYPNAPRKRYEYQNTIGI